jgi:hypothetical protein
MKFFEHEIQVLHDYYMSVIKRSGYAPDRVKALADHAEFTARVAAATAAAKIEAVVEPVVVDHVVEPVTVVPALVGETVAPSAPAAPVPTSVGT